MEEALSGETKRNVPLFHDSSVGEAWQVITRMKEEIGKTDGIFCQYRPCRRDTNTIYDIENIRNGVIYARSPLYMNDPFDSMIGFSSDALLQEIIHEIITDHVEDDTTRALIETVLEYKALGKIAEFIASIKELQRFLRVQRQVQKKTSLNLQQFIAWGHNQLYQKMPPKLKNKLKSKQVFLGIGLIFAETDLTNITDDKVYNMLHLHELLSSAGEKLDQVKTEYYLPAMKQFLKTLTVSCFSAGGWDNQLMWSHYAGNYTGICIEYDFTHIDGSTGFVFPVKYSNERPTLKLKDLGFQFVKNEKGLDVRQQGKTDILNILQYLLVKNECWQYEKEWRIINAGEPDTPRFIRFPYIRSITLGLNVDEVCRRLLTDVCREKEIPCYELRLDSERFALNRVLLDLDAIETNLQKDIEYIQYLCNHIEKIGTEFGVLDGNKICDAETRSFNPKLFSDLFTKANDALFSVCCIRQTISHYLNDNNAEISENDIETLKNGMDRINEGIAQFECDPDVLSKAVTVAKRMGIITLHDYTRCKELIDEFAALLPKAKDAEQAMQ